MELATYFGEGPISLENKFDLKWLRAKIVLKLLITFSIAGILSPIFTGFVAVFLFSSDILFQFIIVLIVFKSYTFYKAFFNTIYTSVGKDISNIVFIGFVYITYLGLVVYLIRSSYIWFQPYIVIGDWTGLFTSIFNYIFGQVLLQWFIPSLVIIIFSLYLTQNTKPKPVVEQITHEKSF